MLIGGEERCWVEGEQGKGVRRLRGRTFFLRKDFCLLRSRGGAGEDKRRKGMVGGGSGKRKGSSTVGGPERSVAGAGENRELLYKQDF